MQDAASVAKGGGCGVIEGLAVSQFRGHIVLGLRVFQQNGPSYRIVRVHKYPGYFDDLTIGKGP